MDVRLVARPPNAEGSCRQPQAAPDGLAAVLLRFTKTAFIVRLDRFADYRERPFINDHPGGLRLTRLQGVAQPELQRVDPHLRRQHIYRTFEGKV